MSTSNSTSVLVVMPMCFTCSDDIECAVYGVEIVALQATQVALYTAGASVSCSGVALIS